MKREVHWLSGRRLYKEGRWTDGKRTVTGEWLYDWGSDTFLVRLDRPRREFVVYGDSPEWGKYRLVRQETPA